MHITLFILSPPGDDFAAAINGCDQLSVLDLCHANVAEHPAVKAREIDVTVYDGEPALSEAMTRAREWLVDCTAAVADQLATDESASLEKAGIATMPLTELAENNSLTRPCYRELVLLELLRETVIEQPPDCVIQIGGREALACCVQRLCRQLNIASRTLAVAPNNRRPAWRHWLTRAHLLTSIASNLRRWRRFQRQHGLKAAKSGNADVLLFSECPREWRHDEGEHYDRYYGTLPRFLSEQSDAPKTAWMMSFFLNEYFVPASEFEASLERFLAIAKTVEGWDLLENYIHQQDLVAAFCDLSAWRLRRALRRRQSELFSWNDIDLSPLFTELIDNSLYAVPLNWVLARAAARMFAQHEASLLVVYGFEFARGKGIIGELRKAQPKARVWGLQHGIITPGEIFYAISQVEVKRPYYPDALLLEGAYAEETMAVFGNPRGRLMPLGCLRDEPEQFRAEHIPPAEVPGRRQVAVVLGLHDCGAMLRFVASAAHDLPDIEILFKFHPLSHAEQWATYLTSAMPQKNYQVITAGMDDVLDKIDLAITSYSGAGLEVLRAGIPVIEIRPDYGIDWGFFSAEPSARKLAPTPAALRELLAAKDWSTYYLGTAAANLLRQCFRDGPVYQRYQAAISEVVEQAS